MLEVSSAAVEAQNNIDFAEIYANSELYRYEHQELIKELSTPLPGSKDLHFPTKYSQSFPTQCKACFWKQHWSYWRNSQYNAIRFFVTIVIGVLFGVIFWGKGDQLETQQDIVTLWELPILLFFSLEQAMLLLCNLWFRLREQFSTEKERQECIQSCLMHLLR
ncbi:hypothetical protein M0R45_009185 [Rubus argutus]|uniref:ABC-2 type transporter transmembrane domain-containing protein n=1 Tax=Rubus argutus TaxID=59490 RepID=A0AAW1Y494_RUBAR